MFISLYIKLENKKEVDEAIKEHGRFLQRKNKSLKIEVFEITKVFVNSQNVFLELDKGKSGTFPLKIVEKEFEFLDETPLVNTVSLKLGENYIE